MKFHFGFAVLGLILGLFFYLSLAFPEGAVQSLYRGTANIPTVESVGGWSNFAVLLTLVAVALIVPIIGVSVLAWIIRRKNLRDVAEAFGVDVSKVAGMSPMEAHEFLSKRMTVLDIIFEDEK